MYRALNDEGVSQVISVLLVVAIVVASIGIIMVWAVPYIEEKQKQSEMATSLSSFNLLDNTVNNLIVEGPGSSASSGFSSVADSGILNVKSGSDKMIVTYTYDDVYNFDVTGLDEEEFTDFEIHWEYNGDEWHNQADDWKYRRKITIDASKVETSMSDFPVMIKAWDVKADDYKNDIAFFNYDTASSKLDHEIEYLSDPSAVTGLSSIVAWVKTDLYANWEYNNDEILEKNPVGSGDASPKFGDPGGLFALNNTGKDYAFIDENGDWTYTAGEDLIPMYKELMMDYDYVEPEPGNRGGLFALDEYGAHYTFIDLDGDWTYDDGELLKSDFNPSNPANPSTGEKGGLLAFDDTLANGGLPYTFIDQDAVIYMYYDYQGSLSNSQNVEGVWNNDYVAVWHLNEETYYHFDSCNNDGGNNLGIWNGNEAGQKREDGRIDGANYFNGSDTSYIQIEFPDLLSLFEIDAITVEAWVKVESYSTQGGQDRRIFIYRDFYGVSCYQLTLENGDAGYGGFVFQVDDITGVRKIESSSKNKVTGGWYYVVGTYDRTDGSIALYVNGIKDTDGNDIPKETNPPLAEPQIGRYKDGQGYFKGIIDELRVSNVARDEKWVKTSYESMQPNSWKESFGQYNLYSLHETIYHDDLKPKFKAADVYRLDLETQKEDRSLEENKKNIYANNMFCQGFTVKDNVNLEKIYLRLSKTGSILDTLKVSIYTANSNGNPASYVAENTISSDTVDYDPGWKSVGINENLGPGNYVIVLSINNFGGNFYNYYSWYTVDHDDFYDQDLTGKAKKYIQSSGEWVTIDDEQFHYRTYYDDPPPDIEDFDYYSSFGWTGRSYTFTLTSDMDDVKFYVDWGDSQSSGWKGNIDADNDPDVINITHVWLQPGSFTIVASVKDKNGNINCNWRENIEVIDLTFYDRVVKPYDLSNTDDPIEISFKETDYAVSGVDILKIGEIVRSPLLIELYPFSNILPAARIWIFDLGKISYTARYGSGNTETFFQNGAIFQRDAKNIYLKDEPIFSDNEDSIALRLILVTGKDTISGVGTHKSILSVVNSFRRERPTDCLDDLYGESNVYDLKLKFYGPNNETWLNYFKNTYDFLDYKLADNSAVRYDYKYQPGKIFIFDTSVIDAVLTYGGS